ncbi:MAG TPA: M2 family metallopeptidase [Phycisphaerae bacterium]|nr:M2 family metallopeptidase [Phycisphaerae bacterium]
MMRNAWIVLVALFAASTAHAAQPDADAEFVALRNAYLAKQKPLFLKCTAAHWEALTTGSEAALERQKATEKALLELRSDRELFARLKALKDGDRVRDPVLRRELDVLYRRLLRAQGPPDLQERIVGLQADVQQIFSTHRSRVGDKTLTENEVREILRTTTDGIAAEAAWKGYTEVGRKAAGKLAELVRLRNEVAQELGYSNYFSMSLALEEIDEAELFRIFDELDQLTREPFTRLKRQVDADRAAHFGISVSELRPWHFGDLFFQTLPPGNEVNLDELYRGADLPELCRRYYASLGLPVDRILANSDLYERPDKYPHGYTINMDRQQDLRVLLNLEPNVRWADIMLHELGHCVNDRYIRPDVPYLLRGPAHALTTEGVAELFGAMAKNEEWLTQMLKVDPAEAARVSRAARESLRRERLIFCRWTQVMVRFEQGMYSNPEQNLGRLWWDLKKRYQLLNPPETVERPDYAAKTHILTAPVYYHSYMLGEMFAAQVRHTIAREVLGLTDPRQTCFFGRPEVGAFLRERVFGPGNLYPWNEYTRRATGEPLTARYFALDLKE